MRTYRKNDAYEPAVATRTHKVFDKILRRNRGRYAAAEYFVQSEYNQQIKLYLEDMRDACLEAMFEARSAAKKPSRKEMLAAIEAIKNEPAVILREDYSPLGLIADIRDAVGDKEGRLMQDELVARCKHP